MYLCRCLRGAPREVQRDPESLTEPQRGTERAREAQRAQRGMYVCMYVGTYVCMYVKTVSRFRKRKVMYCTSQLHFQGRAEQIVHLE